MRMCAPHWEKLRAAIKARGIDHIGAKNSVEAHANMVAELEGQSSNYDPLMSCHWMITNQALRMGGLYLMTQKEDGSEYCPICEALLHMTPSEGTTKEQQEKSWIDGPADAALEECRKLGLVPRVQ